MLRGSRQVSRLWRYTTLETGIRRLGTASQLPGRTHVDSRRMHVLGCNALIFSSATLAAASLRRTSSLTGTAVVRPSQRNPPGSRLRGQIAACASKRQSQHPGVPRVLKTHRHYEGTLFRCAHISEALGCLEARFSVYVPDAPRARTALPYPKDCEGFPMLLYLSGLTCSDENVITKANAQDHCSAEGLIFVAPDTSPRGANLPGEGERFDFGLAAGYYVDATEEPWSQHWRMREYVECELPELVHAHFPTLGEEAVSIMGHSMGGMGALACALRRPNAYQSVSALAPIAHPTAVPSGSSPDVRHALMKYLGDDEAAWHLYDPTQLAQGYRKDKKGPAPPILVDVGADDEFLASGVLKPWDFIEACRQSDLTVDFQMRAGFDHSYFYVSTAIGDHVAFHAKHLDS